MSKSWGGYTYHRDPISGKIVDVTKDGKRPKGYTPATKKEIEEGRQRRKAATKAREEMKEAGITNYLAPEHQEKFYQYKAKYTPSPTSRQIERYGREATKEEQQHLYSSLDPEIAKQTSFRDYDIKALETPTGTHIAGFPIEPTTPKIKKGKRKATEAEIEEFKRMLSGSDKDRWERYGHTFDVYVITEGGKTRIEAEPTASTDKMIQEEIKESYVDLGKKVKEKHPLFAALPTFTGIVDQWKLRREKGYSPPKQTLLEPIDIPATQYEYIGKQTATDIPTFLTPGIQERTRLESIGKVYEGIQTDVSKYGRGIAAAKYALIESPIGLGAASVITSGAITKTLGAAKLALAAKPVIASKLTPYIQASVPIIKGGIYASVGKKIVSDVQKYRSPDIETRAEGYRSLLTTGVIIGGLGIGSKAVSKPSITKKTAIETKKPTVVKEYDLLYGYKKQVVTLPSGAKVTYTKPVTGSLITDKPLPKQVITEMKMAGIDVQFGKKGVGGYFYEFPIKPKAALTSEQFKLIYKPSVLSDVVKVDSKGLQMMASPFRSAFTSIQTPRAATQADIILKSLSKKNIFVMQKITLGDMKIAKFGIGKPGKFGISRSILYPTKLTTPGVKYLQIPAKSISKTFQPIKPTTPLPTRAEFVKLGTPAPDARGLIDATSIPKIKTTMSYSPDFSVAKSLSGLEAPKLKPIVTGSTDWGFVRDISVATRTVRGYKATFVPLTMETPTTDLTTAPLESIKSEYMLDTTPTQKLKPVTMAGTTPKLTTTTKTKTQTITEPITETITTPKTTIDFPGLVVEPPFFPPPVWMFRDKSVDIPMKMPTPKAPSFKISFDIFPSPDLLSIARTEATTMKPATFLPPTPAVKQKFRREVRWRGSAWRFPTKEMVDFSKEWGIESDIKDVGFKIPLKKRKKRKKKRGLRLFKIPKLKILGGK